ncbi:hypothetical protein B4102_2150 [Heyndrickxia sporothermodurans]|uniref:Uncharacterized protein n=1 Tax=Heyndrickxia sporothermodurans TaxID=46224 RepID=A0A150LI59_9BACI|nr:hypothetical protein [Heyndrickxia sporothermodurans]KYD11422.1 hypothetical protein B4102_2150 [Heyndrickxia sporothermodurans]
MKKMYLFEIEADEKPIFNIGEWENLNNLSHKLELAQGQDVVAYGEVADGRYIELYNKN